MSFNFLAKSGRRKKSGKNLAILAQGLRYAVMNFFQTRKKEFLEKL